MNTMTSLSKICFSNFVRNPIPLIFYGKVWMVGSLVLLLLYSRHMLVNLAKTLLYVYNFIVQNLNFCNKAVSSSCILPTKSKIRCISYPLSYLFSLTRKRWHVMHLRKQNVPPKIFEDMQYGLKKKVMIITSRLYCEIRPTFMKLICWSTMLKHCLSRERILELH